MPTIGTFVVFNISPLDRINYQPQFYIAFYIITFGFTFLLPAANCYILLRSGYIKSLRMETKEERRLPYVITSLFYFSEYYLLSLNDSIPFLLKIIVLGATLCVIITLVINMVWKISAHMMGIGGLAGMLIALTQVFESGLNLTLILVFLMAGLIGYSRLRLGEHRPLQVYAGFLVGMFCQWGFLYMYY